MKEGGIGKVRKIQEKEGIVEYAQRAMALANRIFEEELFFDLYIQGHLSLSILELNKMYTGVVCWLILMRETNTNLPYDDDLSENLS